METKFLLVVSLCLLLSTICFAQNNPGGGLSFRGGYITFLMEDINDLVSGGSKLNSGSEIAFNISIKVLEKWNFGLGIGSLFGQSTIIRDTEDHGSSGVIIRETEEIVWALPITLNIAYSIGNIFSDNFKVIVSLDSGYSLVKLGTKKTVSGTGAYSSFSDTAYTYYSGKAPVFQTTINLSYLLFKRLELFAGFGGTYLKSDNLKDKDGNLAKKTDNSTLKLNFSGLKIFAGIGWHF